MKKCIKQIKKGFALLLAAVMVVAVAPVTVFANSDNANELVWIEYGESIRITNTSDERITIRRHYRGGHVTYVRYNADGRVDGINYGRAAGYSFPLQAGQSMVVSMHQEGSRSAFYIPLEHTVVEPHFAPAIFFIHMTAGDSLVFRNVSTDRLTITMDWNSRPYQIERFDDRTGTRIRTERGGFRLDGTVGISLDESQSPVIFQMPYSWLNTMVFVQEGSFQELLREHLGENRELSERENTYWALLGEFNNWLRNGEGVFFVPFYGRTDLTDIEREIAQWFIESNATTKRVLQEEFERYGPDGPPRPPRQFVNNRPSGGNLVYNPFTGEWGEPIFDDRIDNPMWNETISQNNQSRSPGIIPEVINNELSISFDNFFVDRTVGKTLRWFAGHLAPEPAYVAFGMANNAINNIGHDRFTGNELNILWQFGN